MEYVNNELQELLQSYEEFTIEGTVNKNLVSQLARSYDQRLLNLLQTKESIKNHFFSETVGGLIFKLDIFLQFLNNKEFLPDSYTIYKQKIGLANKGKVNLLSESNEVVLNWGYKDTILEGGQSINEAKREELFFNESLAPTEISRMLEAKVLTNFKKYADDGDTAVTSMFNKNENLVVKGNNLVALNSMVKRYKKQVKLIYLDPPYLFKKNVSTDSFQYNSNFKISTWLTFMKNRLEIAKKMLANDSLIFIQINDEGMPYLKILCDEIFGQNNFMNLISVKMAEPTGVKMAHVDKRLPKLKENILVYKLGTPIIRPVLIPKDKWDNEYKTYIKNFSREDYEILLEVEETGDLNKADKILKKIEFVSLSKIYNELSVNKTKRDKFNKDNAYRIVQVASMTGGAKKISDIKYDTLSEDTPAYSIISPKGEVYFIKGGYDRTVSSPRIKLLFAEKYLTKNAGDFWGDIKTTGLDNEGGFDFLNGKKPERLIQRIIEMGTDPGDLVLDFFMGSGTTAAVAMKLGRRFITIDQMDYINEISVPRLVGVLNGVQDGISADVNWKGGGSFVYCELKNDAQDFVNKIEIAETTDQLLELFELAKKSSFISYRVDPKKLKSVEFRELSFAEQKQLLREIIDNNNLYVNYSDIEDTSYGISAEDIALNRLFYGDGE